MIDLQSKSFQLIWGTWILILGISLLFIHTFQYVHSFSEYLRAFIILDMPASWCPTFLSLYGFAVLTAYLLTESRINRAFAVLALIAGIFLLPIGIYTTYTFTVEQPFTFDFIYIYAQTIHVSEFLTGLLTIFLLVKSSTQVKK